jgi:adenylate cyclase
MAKIRLTIGIKLNAIVVGLQILTTIGIVSIATYLFSEEFPGLLRKSNLDAASLLAGRVRSEVLLVADRMRSSGLASLEQFKSEDHRLSFLEELIGADDQLFAIGLYEFKRESDYVVRWRAINRNSKNRIERSAIDELDRRNLIGWDTVRKGEVDFVASALKDGRPTIRIAVPFLEKSKGNFSHFLVADLYQERLSALFRESSAFSAYLLDANGRVLASTDPQRFRLGLAADGAILNRLQGDLSGVGQFDYVDNESRFQIASVQSVGFANLKVVTQAPTERIEVAKLRLYRRSGLLAALIVSFAVWLAVLFSSHVKLSINRLAEAARKVTHGDFFVKIPIKTPHPLFEGDEIEQVSRAFNEMVGGLQERNRVKSAFSKLHGQRLADKMISGNLKLGGERRECVVFFSDIRGFTPLSEKMDPEHVVALLNRYFSAMIGVIEKNGGIITGFQGDSIMAVWGLHEPVADCVDRAISTCLEMRKTLASFNGDLISEGRQPLFIGMSLHHGPVVAGMVGSESRMSYSAIGDTTNTASRIESATKEFGTDLLVSDTVLQLARSRYLVEMVEAKLKGKRKPVIMFKILGFTDAAGIKHIVRTPFSQFDPERMNSAAFEETFVSGDLDPKEKTEVTGIHILVNE